MPATFSAIGAAGAAVVPEVPVDPGEAAEGASGAAACPAALPHFGQNAALSAICVPQAEQNAMKTSSSYPRRTITELDGERKWNSEHLLRIARMLDSSPRGCPPSAGQRVSFSEWRRANSERRFLCPAALLVLLAAAAWARIVAADLSPRTTCCTGPWSPPPAIRACSSSRRLRRWKASSMSSIEVVARPRREPVLNADTALPLPLPGASAGWGAGCGASITCIRYR